MKILIKTALAATLLSGCTNTLETINYEINSNTYITGKYDCRNYVDDKYTALIKEGFRDSDMQFILTSYKGQPHVVLNVNGVILDNNYKHPYPATKELTGGVNYKAWSYYRKTYK